MKKILLGTSALCALAIAGPAGAQTMNEPIKLGFGGYFNSAYGGMLSESGGNVAGKRRDDINTDAVLQVKGSTKLDNGITVGAMIQFRAENSFNGGSNSGDFGAANTLQDVIKKQYIKVVTDFGVSLALVNVLLVQPDGKIVAVGFASNGTPFGAVARYTP